VTVSYFEWCKTARLFSAGKRVNERLLDVIENAFDQVSVCGNAQSEQRMLLTWWPLTGVAKALKMRGI